MDHWSQVLRDMKKAATSLQLLFLGVLFAAFFVPSSVLAFSIRGNSVADTTFTIQQYPNAYSVNQIGVGYETFFSSSTPISGVVFWVDQKNSTTANSVQVCLYSNEGINGYDAETSWKYYRYTAPSLVLSKCVTGTLTSDSNGLVTVPLSVPWTANSSRFMSLGIVDVSGAAPTGYTPWTKFVGTQYDYGVITQYSGSYNGSLGQAATSSGSFYFSIYSGAPSTQFNASLFFPQVSTSTLPVVCQSNFSTSTSILDSVGSSIAYGLCLAGTYLFIPSQQQLDQYGDYNLLVQTKIPFSYFYDVKSEIDSLSATSTDNVPTYSVDLASAAVSGSTTPIGNFLPHNLSILSSTTINTYLPNGVHTALFTLASAAIWFSAGYYIYHRSRKVFAPTT